MPIIVYAIALSDFRCHTHCSRVIPYIYICSTTSLALYETGWEVLNGRSGFMFLPIMSIHQTRLHPQSIMLSSYWHSLYPPFPLSELLQSYRFLPLSFSHPSFSPPLPFLHQAEFIIKIDQVISCGAKQFCQIRDGGDDTSEDGARGWVPCIDSWEQVVSCGTKGLISHTPWGDNLAVEL